MLFLLFAAPVLPEPIVTPYFQRDPLAIRSVQPLATTVLRFGVEELKVNLAATYDNPFDPDDITVNAKIVAPSGATSVVPGFLYRAYTRALTNGTEVLTKAGDPDWRVRICPLEAGDYTVTVTVKDRDGSVTSSPAHFTTTPSTLHGIVRVSPGTTNISSIPTAPPATRSARTSAGAMGPARSATTSGYLPLPRSGPTTCGCGSARTG